MLQLAALGYAVVSIAFFLLIGLLLTSWRGKRLGGLLITACLVSVVWAAVMAVQTATLAVNPLILYIAEIGRLFAWCGFLVYLAASIGVVRWLRWLCVGLGVTGVLAGPVALFVVVRFGVTVNVTQLLIAFGLSLSLCGLLLIEQLYRNTSLSSRWAIKALAVGLGGLFAYELFYYSQAVLFGALDAVTWAARGWVNVLFVPAIAIAARRSPDWDLRIFVSRQVVFYTTTLVAVGVYFLLMSLGGFLLVQFGGSWGAMARAVFFVGAAVVLAALLSSSSLRGRFKIFLHKHFFQNKYDYREEWLRLVSTLADFDGDAGMGVAVRAIAEITDSPSGVLWVRDAQEDKFKREADWDCPDDMPDLEFSEPLVKFIEETGWVVDLDELAREPDRYDGMELPGWLALRQQAWLLVPFFADKVLIGFVLLNRAPAPRRLNYEDHDLLKTAGNHIAVHLAQAQSESLLSEARQFEAYNRLTAFLMHDLNNLIAQQSLIVANAEKHKRNPEFVDDAIATIAGSVERMKSVMEQLRRGQSDKSIKRRELRSLASKAIERCVHRQPIPELIVNEQGLKVSAEPKEFVTVLANLIKNAQEAATVEGSVRVVVDRDGSCGVVQVEDDGAGMSEEFIRKRLFRPFDSTKGNQGMGIGVYQAREYARRMGGDLGVESTVGAGTSMTMSIPLIDDDG